MVVICLFILAAMSLNGLRSKARSVKVIVGHGVLWGVAGLTAFLIANTSIEVGVHPIATTAAMLILGAISLSILVNAKFEEVAVAQETSAE